MPVEQPDATRYPVLTFGKYRQKTGSVAKEDIRWYVVDIDDDGAALLLAEKGLDAQPWHHAKKCTQWEDSDLYRWLNGFFAREAFSDGERAALKTTPEGGKVTMFSREEAQRYLEGDGAACAVPTLRAKAQGAFAYSYSDTAPQHRKYAGNGTWWLRNTMTDMVKAVYWDGSFCEYGPDYRRCMVRPAVRLDMEKAFGKQHAGRLTEAYRSRMMEKT